MDDNSPAPDQPEESLDKHIEERNALSEATCQQVCIIYYSKINFLKVCISFSQWLNSSPNREGETWSESTLQCVKYVLIKSEFNIKHIC